MLAGIGMPIVMLAAIGASLGISADISSDRKEEALTTATSEIGQEFDRWLATNPDSIADMDHKELSYDQFTQKIHDTTDRKEDIVETSNITYLAGNDGEYEICVVTTSTGITSPDHVHIYSSETNMVADAQKCE
ncbi:MAG: hypothetical protein H9W81_07405 [Enterococcus sp.]|nr:hypothetical protein [Enterococcus sp.]